jgi:hypothetical protein
VKLKKWLSTCGEFSICEHKIESSAGDALRPYIVNLAWVFTASLFYFIYFIFFGYRKLLFWLNFVGSFLYDITYYFVIQWL